MTELPDQRFLETPNGTVRPEDRNIHIVVCRRYIHIVVYRRYIHIVVYRRYIHIVTTDPIAYTAGQIWLLNFQDMQASMVSPAHSTIETPKTIRPVPALCLLP